MVCVLAVIAGSARLDLKGLAKVAGDRHTETVALKEVQPLTGYIRGGVTALACKKDYPVYVDETIALFDLVSVSAGVRGTQILLHPSDYLRAVKARTGQSHCFDVARLAAPLLLERRFERRPQLWSFWSHL
jgi:Cys-tRNA(Pro)/Cys-tRNA(Cys) deacylase